MKFHPQAYYLRMDQEDGFYLTATLSLARRDFPLSIQTIVNQPISTNITGGDDFLECQPDILFPSGSIIKPYIAFIIQ